MQMKEGSSWAPGGAWLEGNLNGLKTLDKPAMIHTYNPNISVVEAAETDSQGQPRLPSKFEANLIYNRRPCF